MGKVVSKEVRQKQKKCSVEGCNNKVKPGNRFLCSTHEKFSDWNDESIIGNGRILPVGAKS